MNTRTARRIRLGILAARDPELLEHINAAQRVVRTTCLETLRRQQVRRLRNEEARNAWHNRVIVNAGWHMDQLIRSMFPKPIPDTFKAAPKPATFTVPAWHKHHSETTPYAPISEAVARRAAPEQAAHLRRVYA